MGAAIVQEFRKSVAQRGAESTVVSPAEAEDAIRDAIEQPAVAAPSPFDDLPFDGLPVTVGPSAPELQRATTGLSGSRLGISSLGMVSVESQPGGDELVSLYPERHVVVVCERDLEPGLSSAFAQIESAFEAGRDSMVFATGPSATGDMGAIVQGVHGPGTVHVVVTDDE